MCHCPNIGLSICRYRDRFPWCVPVSQYLCVDMSLQGQVSMVCACVPVSVCRYVATGTGFHGDDDDVGLNVLGCRVDILGTKFHGVCLCPSISVSICRNSSVVCACVPISVLGRVATVPCVCLCPNTNVLICRYRMMFPWRVPVSQNQCVDVSYRERFPWRVSVSQCRERFP